MTLMRVENRQDFIGIINNRLKTSNENSMVQIEQIDLEEDDFECHNKSKVL